MPIAIPDPGKVYRYGRAEAFGRQSKRVQLSDVFRAYADDLIDGGDARVVMERAFRWGHRDEQGNHVEGLQERLQELRFRRDSLLRQIEQRTFLEGLAGELDRINALEQEGDVAGEPSGADEQQDDDIDNLDRLARRLEEGYATNSAQEAFEQLIGQLQSSAGDLDNDGSSASNGEKEGPSNRDPQQGTNPFTSFPAGRADAARRVMQMLFEGGSPAGEVDDAGAQWRRTADRSPAGDLDIGTASDDVQLLKELKRLHQALADVEQIGSVLDLGDCNLHALLDVLDPDDAAWVRDWHAVVGAATSSQGGAGVSGQVSLPPEVVSAIGRDLLRDLFNSASSPIAGEHRSMERGNSGDAAEATVGWEFGEPLDLNLVSTVSNAVRRVGNAGSAPIRLSHEDFDVFERTATTAVSTVMAIDRSRSMGQSGAWGAAKKVALAMHELIRQSYPRDSLDIVTFSSSAGLVSFDNILTMDWDQFEHGTHMQAALELGRTLHRQSRAGTRQIVVITDGEPTLATVSGEEVFSTPPNEAVINATIAEVQRCTREGIVINIVMLGNDGEGPAFVHHVARVNRGRVFLATNERLGTYILRDYVDR